MKRIPGKTEKTLDRVGKIKMMQRELEGKACPFCGGLRFYLVLQAQAQAGTNAAKLAVRCSHCHGQREFEQGEIEKIFGGSKKADEGTGHEASIAFGPGEQGIPLIRP